MEEIKDKMSKAVREAGICHCTAQQFSELLDAQMCLMYCGLRQEVTEEEIKQIESNVRNSK